MRLNCVGRGQQVAKLEQRRRGPPALFGGTLENALLILKAQRADAARIVDSQEEVEGVQGTALDIRTGTSGFLPPFGMVTQDDAARPAVWFGVRNRALKHGSAVLFAMKLRASHEGKAGTDREAVRDRQPCGVILEGGALPRALRVEAECPKTASVFPQRYTDGSPHSPAGAFFGRTRLGSRSTSSNRPISSRRGSTMSPIASPNPSAKSAIA